MANGVRTEREVVVVREVLLELRPGRANAVGRALAAEPALARERVRYVSRAPDGSAVTLCRFRGDPEAAAGVLGAAAGINEYDLAVTGDRVHAYIRFEPGAVLGRLLRLLDERGLVLAGPVACVGEAGFRATLVGPGDDLRAAMDRFPDGVGVEFHRVRDHEPGDHSLEATLTARQREVLRAAVGEGYYEVPKEATCRDVAENVGLASATVGEHLQKIEARVLSKLV